MKYLFRFIGVFILWPFTLIYSIVGYIVLNTISILYHLNFKHIWWKWDKYDWYFYITRNNLELNEVDLEKSEINWIRYDEYYKTPLDMLKNKLIKEYKN